MMGKDPEEKIVGVSKRDKQKKKMEAKVASQVVEAATNEDKLKDLKGLTIQEPSGHSGKPDEPGSSKTAPRKPWGHGKRPQQKKTGQRFGGSSNHTKAKGSDPTGEPMEESEGSPAAPETSKPKKEPLSPERLAKLQSWVGETWTGTTAWFNVRKGYGFIQSTMEDPEKAKEMVFAHYKNIQTKSFGSLGDDEKVEFEVDIGAQGLQAINIRGEGGAEIKGHHIRPIISKSKEELIKCYKCGLYGHHRASQCKKDIAKSACYWCGSTEHLGRSCPLSPEQKHKRGGEGSGPPPGSSSGGQVT